MNQIKKGLAILGLASMAVFVVSVIVLTLTGGLAEHRTLTFGSLGAFLLTGGAAVIIDRLQKRAEKAKAAEDEKK